MFNNRLLRQSYIATLAAIAFFLPLSVWLVSVFILMNFLIWIIGGGLKRLTGDYKRNLYIFIFSGIYIIHIIWMINTSNTASGLLQLWQKLPFIMLPLSIGLSDPLNKKEMKTTLSFFVGGVMVSSVIGVALYLIGKETNNIEDPRKISLFIPYIRLSMETNLAIAISVWYLFMESSKLLRVFYFFSAIWLILFLFLLLSVTGILIFSIIVVVSVFLFLQKSGKKFLKTTFAILVSACFTIAGVYISNEIKSFYNKCNKYTYPLKEKTLNGNVYTHFPERKDIENGNPVWIYISEQEMRKEWNLRSHVNYDSNDLRDQKLSVTLIRYLTSVGLTKDSAGISQLKDQDIKFVESGITNRLFTEGKPIKSKIYEIIWQIDYYRNGGNPSGHSVTQRIEFFKTGLNLLKRNFFFGTGTGDLKDEMTAQYERDKSKLNQEYRFLPHNQYLNSLLTFGIFGFLTICLFVLLPVTGMKTYRNFLFNMFFLIILLSMFGEDIMETHTGVCFFTYFYTLFVFGEDKNEY
jgi:hypothetical protein